ncbi:MAG TPA: HD domain-containing phosphohydrolase [Polyangiaceae bacterium]|nr:HD domain-containing phosphohydrolase [Polyangiaceae bacterium]
MRLAELVGTFSLATDAGTGVPEEHGLCAAAVAVELAKLAGKDAKTQRDAFYLTLLRYSGCSAGAHTAATVLSDELEFAHEAKSVDYGRLSEMLPLILARAVRGQGLAGLSSLASVFGALAKMPEVGREHCETAVVLARRLGFDEPFFAALHQGFERWDGSGQPTRARGEAIALPMRLAAVALDAHRGYLLDGASGAAAFVRKHSGRELDPTLAALWLEHAERFDALFTAPSSWQQALDAEPAPFTVLDEAEIDTALSALADFSDLKSRYTRGHSRGVAELARRAAQVLGLGAGLEKLLYRAGLVHDIGRVGVSSLVWDKAEPLSEGDWERVRFHSYVGERILSRAEAMRGVAELAGLTHERLDGHGYHRRLTQVGCTQAARVLAAADTYQALIEARPHRPARSPSEAAAELRNEAAAGKLATEAVEAVLAAAGHRSKSAAPAPATTLTPRELEVLALVARGATNKEVASELGISAKTAGRHLEHIYEKLGVTTRAGATMLALERGLLDLP